MFLPIILVVGAYYIFTKDNNMNFSKEIKDPKNRLKERFIKGEIDEETYYKMKAVIDEE